jgi:hypothetical protein
MCRLVVYISFFLPKAEKKRKAKQTNKVIESRVEGAKGKGVFVWDYNPPRLYNTTIFELTLSSKVVRLYNLDRL